MANKIKCLVNGRELNLSPEAYKMAHDYFGAEKLSDLIAAKPIELSKPLLIPKPLVKEIIKPIEKVVEKPAEVIKPIEDIMPKPAFDPSDEYFEAIGDPITPKKLAVKKPVVKKVKPVAKKVIKKATK